MKLSVIIPCFNAADTIAVQLEALAQQEWVEPWEIIIADNGSTDRSIEIIKTYQQRLLFGDKLKIVDASKKRGAAHARNVGASVAQSEALAFCDADDEVAPGWVAAMGTALCEYDLAGGRDEHYKLNEPWLVKTFGCENGFGVGFDHPYLPLISGNNFGVKRKLHQAIGGFDENIAILDDVDYGWRIQQQGIKPHQVEDALIHFRFRNNIKDICSRSWNMGCQEALMYKKHRQLGMPQLISWKTIIKTAVMFPPRFLTRLRDKAALTQSLMDLAWRGGQLQGCFKYNYLPW